MLNQTSSPIMWSTIRRWLLGIGVLALLAALALAACKGSDAPEELPDPFELLQESSQLVSDAGSLRLLIEIDGAPVFIDQDRFMNVRLARGLYVAPDRLHAVVRMLFDGAPIQVEMIIIGPEQYYLIPPAGWLRAILIPDLDPTAIFAADVGLRAAMESIRELEMLGTQRLHGVQTYHMRGMADGADVASLTVGLIGQGQVEAEIWIRTDTLMPERFVLVEPERATEEDGPPIWTIEMYDYDIAATIETPHSFDTPEPDSE